MPVISKKLGLKLMATGLMRAKAGSVFSCHPTASETPQLPSSGLGAWPAPDTWPHPDTKWGAEHGV